jgi:hypothetical protein
MQDAANALTSKGTEFAQQAGRKGSQGASSMAHGVSSIKKSIERLFN